MRTITVLACVLLLSTVATPGTALDPDLDLEPLDPIPTSHPLSLGEVLGCGLDGFPYGYFTSPPAQDEDCVYEPAGHSVTMDVLRLDCENACLLALFGFDENNFYSEWVVQCQAGSGGTWVFTDDPLADAFLQDESQGDCFNWYGGDPPLEDWDRWYGYMEDVSRTGGITATAYENWVDAALDTLL